MKKLILFLALLVQLLALKPWLLCRNFIYHFSVLDLNLQLIDAIHTDYGSILVTRIFHNKPVFFILDIYKRYVHYIDIQFLTALISFVGFLGLLFGVWYFLSAKKKHKTLAILLMFIVIFPLMEILLDFKINFAVKLGLFWLPLIFFSSWGNWRFLEEKKQAALIILLFVIIFSFVFLIIYPQNAYFYCSKP